LLDSESLALVQRKINERAKEDKFLIDTLINEIRPLLNNVCRISPRSATALSLVATDGGNTKIEFDPYLMQLVRVVDSFGKLLCLDIVSPTTNTNLLSINQFYKTGEPKTALGLLMKDLNVDKIYELSHMVPNTEALNTEEINPSWVQAYRDLCEWAALYEQITKNTFATDTLIVRDGLLRSPIFAKDYFLKMFHNIEIAINKHWEEQKRKIYIVGFAKSSKVLTRYKLAMSIEEIMKNSYPCYLEIPRNLEEKAYIWPDYAFSESEPGSGRKPRYVKGKLFFVKFGDRIHDQIWAVDILEQQKSEASIVFGCLLEDSRNGFPTPLYPRCLQKAHEKATIEGFDNDILQEQIFDAIKNTLPEEKQKFLDEFKLLIDRRKIVF